MIDLNTINDALPTIEPVPFRHFILPQFLSGKSSDFIKTLDEAEGWRLRSVEDFYDTFDLDLARSPTFGEIDGLAQPCIVTSLRKMMERTFEVRLQEEVDVVVQKMVVGQRIGLHTDYGPLGQSHRLLLQLNRGWSVNNGGLLMLFDEEFPQVISNDHRYYVPLDGTAIGFEISPRSFHAVSKVESGTRYTVTYSYRPAI